MAARFLRLGRPGAADLDAEDGLADHDLLVQAQIHEAPRVQGPGLLGGELAQDAELEQQGGIGDRQDHLDHLVGLQRPLGVEGQAAAAEIVALDGALDRKSVV